MTTTAAAARHTPPPATHRLPALDVLRGLAILGTLLTNIWIFASPRELGALAPGELDAAVAAGGRLQEAFGVALSLVTDGKWIGLLTIMFGIGLEIQRQSAIRKGESWPGTYPWRALLLVVEGALNYVFIFEFDVLMGYGLTALVVCAVLATSPRVQAVWLGIGIALHLALIAVLSGMFGGLGALGAEDELAEDDPFASDELWLGVEELTAGGRRPGEAELSALAAEHGVEVGRLRDLVDVMAVTPGGTDSYWAMVLERVHNFWFGRAEIPVMLTMGLGLFLVGAFLYRNGLFLPAGRRLRRWVMGLAFGVGLPVDVACRTLFVEEAGAFPRYVTSALVSFGMLAAVAAFYAHRQARGQHGTGVVGTALSWVGRTALTCYLLQNLIASLIFYDFGLGLAGRLDPATADGWTLVVFAGISFLLVVGAGAWLSRFNRGPIELVMHQVHGRVVEHVHRPLAARRRARRDRRHSGPR